MPGLTVSGSSRIGAMVRQSFAAMTPAERTRVTTITFRRSPTPGGRVTG